MSRIVDLEKARLGIKVKKGFRNWVPPLEGQYGVSTCMGDIPDKVIEIIAGKRENSAFLFYDLIMTLKELGSGFSFNELEPDEKLVVIDIHHLTC